MSKELHFLGLDFESGQSHSGLCHSPNFARQLFPELQKNGYAICDHGDFFRSSPSQPSQKPQIHELKDLAQIDWRPFQNANRTITQLLRINKTVLNWGGDHSIAVSTVSAFQSVHPDGVVLWIDAHADINLPMTSLTGNLHGMPIALLLNLANTSASPCQTPLPWQSFPLSAQNLIYLGVRDLDPFEKEVLISQNILCISMTDIHRLGIAYVLDLINEVIGSRALHVSFDIDSVNPELAPATGVPVADGLGRGDLHAIGNFLRSKRQLKSLDVVEINPHLGSRSEVLKTYQVAFEFLNHILCPTVHTQGGYHACNRQPISPEHQASVERNFAFSTKSSIANADGAL